MRAQRVGTDPLRTARPSVSLPSRLKGRNSRDERHNDARLNTKGCMLVMLSNNAGEFGPRFVKEF